MDKDKPPPSNRWPFPPPVLPQDPQGDKGQDTERVSGRTPATEPPKEKRSDDH